MLEKAYLVFQIPRKGIIHIGAHQAEELALYEKWGVKNVLWIEANPLLEKSLLEKISAHKGSSLAIFAASNDSGKAILHVPKLSAFASMYQPQKILEKNLPIGESTKVEVDKKRLDDYLKRESNTADYNMMVIDTQGYEKIILEGAPLTLQKMDGLIIEASFFDMYKGTPKIMETDQLLREAGFVRYETLIPLNRIDGDALYVKRKFIESGHALPVWGANL